MSLVFRPLSAALKGAALSLICDGIELNGWTHEKNMMSLMKLAVATNAVTFCQRSADNISVKTRIDRPKT